MLTLSKLLSSLTKSISLIYNWVNDTEYAIDPHTPGIDGITQQRRDNQTETTFHWIQSISPLTAAEHYTHILV